MSKRINNNYTKEFKLKAVKMYLDEGVSCIKSKTQVINWVKQFQEKGADSFDIETRGRGTGGKRGRPKTKFNSLEEEVEYLRMEVEFLKKLRALSRNLK